MRAVLDHLASVLAYPNAPLEDRLIEAIVASVTEFGAIEDEVPE